MAKYNKLKEYLLKRQGVWVMVKDIPYYKGGSTDLDCLLISGRVVYNFDKTKVKINY